MFKASDQIKDKGTKKQRRDRANARSQGPAGCPEDGPLAAEMKFMKMNKGLSILVHLRICLINFLA